MKTKYNLARKIAATIIDYTLIFAFYIWYIFEFGLPNEEGSYTISGLGALLPILVWVLYFVIAEKYCAATLGHEIVKLKVVSVDGAELSFGQVFKRRICDALEISWCFGIIAFFIAENNDKHQRLGDILAKTLVIGKNDVYEPVRNRF
ncbi:RDD family protein [Pedobacter frigiditerrae]|uniref:RDD family protein n=1 Tax=Pedobacter frigiditerrae TaxID=2530452 RepID=UPI0013F14AD6|nr:RDD family protein [Pedobacter frigiditerrae]